MGTIPALFVWAALATGQSAPLQLLEFTSPGCGPCRSMIPVVDQLRGEGYPIQVVDIAERPELAQHFRVQRVPCFVLVAGQQEVSRHEGTADAATLAALFERQGRGDVATGASGAATGPIQVTPPDLGAPSVAGQTGVQPAASVAGLAPPLLTAAAPVQQGTPPLTGSPNAAPRAQAPNSQPPQPTDPQYASIVALGQRALEATVRIRVREAQGFDTATGTIIDVHGDEALAITCGHVFAPSEGGGEVLVDLFVDGARQGIPAKIIDRSEKPDVALISFVPGVPVRPMPVAAQPEFNERSSVFSVGCDAGAPPTIRHSRITRLNRYLGPANIEVAGAPAQGRSGGGLFDAKGRLIGICNFAQHEDDEGIYAALPNIHWQLERVGQAQIFRGTGLAPRALAMDGAPEAARAAVSAAPEASLPAVEPPNMRSPLATTPVANSARPSANELLCIVREADGNTRMLVVPAPSPRLLEQLESSATQHLASGRLAPETDRVQPAIVRGQNRR